MPPLWEGGGIVTTRSVRCLLGPSDGRRPPPSQSGGSVATALQSFAKYAATRASMNPFPPMSAGLHCLARLRARPERVDNHGRPLVQRRDHLSDACSRLL